MKAAKTAACYLCKQRPVSENIRFSVVPGCGVPVLFESALPCGAKITGGEEVSRMQCKLARTVTGCPGFEPDEPVKPGCGDCDQFELVVYHRQFSHEEAMPACPVCSWRKVLATSKACKHHQDFENYRSRRREMLKLLERKDVFQQPKRRGADV